MGKRDNQKNSIRNSRVSLRIEQLEQRMMLNGDNNPAPLADADTDGTLQAAIAPAFFPADAGFDSSLAIAVDDVGPRNFFPRANPLPAMPEEGFQSVEEVRAWVIGAIDTQYEKFFGASLSYPQYPWYGYRISSFVGTLSVAFDADDSLTLADSFSGTNVQVEGVDEADLIETDGKYLYLVSGNELIIVDARDSEDLSIASRVQLKERPTGIYLSGDRLTLISTGARGNPYSSWGYGNLRNATTTVTVLDLADRTAPTQVQKTEIQGSLVSSRMVDGQLRLVLSQQRFTLPSPELNNDTVNGKPYSSGGTYESRADYLNRVLEDAIDSLLPTSRSLSVEGEVLAKTRLISPGELREVLSARTSIATFNVHSNDAGPSDVKTLLTKGATEIYATEESLYVFENSRGNFSNRFSSRATTIRKFDFDADDHSITLAATGKVEGNLLNQFSADEYDGYLRVVTNGASWNSGQSLFVLEQVGNQLKVVGTVDNLAPGEDIYSVRFLGERAFVVTFLRVDPLFAIDLSDPTNPTVAGELKIPGYSDYLQPLGEGFLLGIGRGANESTGLFQEMQLSIFDVSNLSDPQLTQRFSFEGGRSTTSIATGNRWTRGDNDSLAVSYFPSEQILALPIQSAGATWRGGGSSSSIFEQGEGGLQLFFVDTEAGFESLGIIEHDSPILRSLRIGDSLFAFSAGEITTHNLTGSIGQLDSLQLLVGSEIGLTELTDFSPPPSAAGIQATVNPIATTINRGAFVPTVRPSDRSLSVAEKALLSVSSVSSLPTFRNVDSNTEAIDAAFSSEDSTDAEDSRYALDDLLLDELLSVFVGEE